MIAHVIQRLISAERVEPGELEAALHEIMSGNAEPAQLGGLLVALAARPVDAGLLAAAARVMRAHRVAVEPPVRPAFDTCGTGGDGAGTFNVSTATAMVVAAAGVPVAKHGNRGVSSPVGSADVLEAAGARPVQTAAGATKLLMETGFVFLFAPAFHPAMRHVAPARRALGIRTIFNLLGPLANPAAVEQQLLGVYDAAMTETLAQALRALGAESALVVHCEGVDEIGLHGVTTGHRLRGGEVEPFRLAPEDLGLQRAPCVAIAGGDAAGNLRILQRVLGGEPGPHADIVALNAAAALEVCGRVPDLRQGLAEAREILVSGAARGVLDLYIEHSRKAEAP